VADRVKTSFSPSLMTKQNFVALCGRIGFQKFRAILLTPMVGPSTPRNMYFPLMCYLAEFGDSRSNSMRIGVA